MGCRKLTYSESLPTLEIVSNNLKISVKSYAADYRYGFNGMEKDDEIKGEGNSYTTPFRMLDPRLGRWLSIDPVVHEWVSPYNTFDNSPLIIADPSGGNGDVTIKNKEDSPESEENQNRDLLVLSNTVYLFNEGMDANKFATEAALYESRINAISGQNFNGVDIGDGEKSSLMLVAEVKVIIVGSKEEAMRLANGGSTGNVMGLNAGGGSYVVNNGSEAGWVGSTDVNGTGNEQHEWLHLFGLSDRYIIGINKPNPLELTGPNNPESNFRLAMAMPGDKAGYAKGGNVMVQPTGGGDVPGTDFAITTLSKGQINFFAKNIGKRIVPGDINGANNWENPNFEIVIVIDKILESHIGGNAVNFHTKDYMRITAKNSKNGGGKAYKKLSSSMKTRVDDTLK